ncbi:MAG: ATP-binding protein [Coriobacteriia bacterium]|nr:ATP-binding protein [Coriobacteriia bacterium]
MSKFKRFIYDYFITDELSFESRTLNFVCLFGAIASLLALISRIIAGLPFITMVPLLIMIVAIVFILIVSLRRGKNAGVLTTLIVSGVSVVFWPFLFFTIGGPGSGMAVYFALAIILNFTLLKGKARYIVLAITLIITVFCYTSTLFFGWGVLPEGGLTTYQLFVDILQSVIIVGFLMGVIILYQTKLFKNQKKKGETANEEIKHNEELLTLINEASIILLAAETDRYEETLSESMEKIAVCLDIDCVYIWRTDERDGFPVYTQFYSWQLPGVEKEKTLESISGSNSLERVIEWDDKLLGEKGYIAEPVSSFSGYMYEMLAACGIQAIMAFPVFFQGRYWGFVSFENRHSEKLCSEREAAILQSGSLLLANAIDRHESMIELDLAQRTTSAMFEANPHINVLFNSSFKVVDCNPAACQFLGFETKEELLEMFVPRMVASIPAFQPDGRPSVPLPQRLITAVREGQVNFETELHLPGEDIKTLSVEFKRIPYGDSFAIVGYVFDMTEIHQREMELKHRDQLLSEAVAEARAANLAKSSFLATMSHEIRTPMNAILGITEIQLFENTLSKSTREAFGKISASGDMLLGIINDILDLSKIEAGKLELIIDSYEIASVLSDSAQLNMMRIGSKPIEFELHIDENMPAILSGDELRVKQILNNILSNAFKYTTSGTVELSVSAEPIVTDADLSVVPDAVSAENEVIQPAVVLPPATENGRLEYPYKRFCDCSAGKIMLVLTIRDTGQGMSQEQINKLFDEYSRFNMEANRSTEGTGLGMSITQKLIRLMDGEISVVSELEKGSTFTVRLPQNVCGSAVLGKEVAENLQNFRSSSRAQMRRVQITREPMPYGSVLIVDDVETNIYVAKGLLTPYELKIDTADSGFVAIEKIKNGAEYDVVFMDHMMPKMDGVEATQILRGLGYTKPIVALTANAVTGQSDMFLSNGFDDFISKPIDIRQLNAVLNRLVRDKQAPELVETLRNRLKPPTNGSSEEEAEPALNPRFAEIFARDANKSLAAICSITENDNAFADKDELRTYSIHVHGMKSALANVGKMELSAVALKLEMAARDGNTEVLIAETPAFVDALKTLVDSLMPKEASSDDAAEEADPSFVQEKLLVIRAACEELDERTAENTVAELRAASLSPSARELLSRIDELLLHSDFFVVVDIIDEFLK